MSLDPISKVQQWVEEGRLTEPSEPEAMSVATVDLETGQPSLRLVLLRGIEQTGFVFYSNLNSRKAREIKQNSLVALALHWKSLGRQARVEGVASIVSDSEADNYFASRERGSQIGAWASTQSAKLQDREFLLARVKKFDEKFEGQPVKRPDYWSGYRVTPSSIELWETGTDRLHRRDYYWLDNGVWKTHLLYP